MQVTYKQYAWIAPHYGTIERIAKGDGIPMLSSAKPGEGGYFEREGHACVGEASVTLTINAPDKIATDQIAALNAKLQNVRADAQQKENQILLQISKLQALTMSEADHPTDEQDAGSLFAEAHGG